jgi:hypothetical protein
LAVYAVSRDIGNNSSPTSRWRSLIDKTGGVVDGDLAQAADNKSALFTAHAVGTARISADHASLVDDTSGVVTVVETLPDDIHEENDTFASATELSLGTHDDLVIYDEDWYKFYVSPADAGKDLKLRLRNTSVPDPAGSRDMDFSVFDSSEKLLGSTYSGFYDELLYLPDKVEGWYYIGHLNCAQTGSIYSLTVEIGDEFGLGYVSGRVTDRLGNGLENVFVEARNVRSFADWNVGFSMVVTNSNGEYKIGYAPGDYRISFNSSDLAYFDEPWAPNANYLGDTYADLITITAGATVANVNARLEEGGSISGRVTDRYGNPLQLALVWAFNSGPSAVSAGWTKPNGEFRVTRLRTGNYKLRIRPWSELAYGWFENAVSFEDAALVRSGRCRDIRH